MELRPYQERAIEQLRLGSRNKHQGQFLVLPTGGGKTICFAEITRSANEKGKTVLILAHRTELLQQASEKLTSLGVHHGLIQGSLNTDPAALTQVASIDTLCNRHLKEWKPNLIIIDEAHGIAARRFEKVLSRWHEAYRLLVSATPYRLDGKGFRAYASNMVIGATVRELIDQGYLVEPHYLTGDIPDLQAIKTIRGDYNEKQLENTVNTKVLRANVVDTILKHASGLTGIVFCVSVAHSQAMADEFNGAGIIAEHLDGNSPKHERKAILSRLSSGKTQVVTNVNVLSEGFDCPSIGFVSLARPTQSRGLYIQQAGRVLRTHPGKTQGLIFDHAGCFHRFGSVDTPINFSLDGNEQAKQSRKKEKLVCIKCGSALNPSGKCTWCYEPVSTHVIYVPGELQTVTQTEFGKKIIEAYQNLLIEAAKKRNANGKHYRREWAFYKMLKVFPVHILERILGRSEVPYSLRNRPFQY